MQHYSFCLIAHYFFFIFTFLSSSWLLKPVTNVTTRYHAKNLEIRQFPSRNYRGFDEKDVCKIGTFIYMSIGWILNFTITERILEGWSVESYGLWNYRPWKWRNMSRSAGCFVRRKLRINVIVKTKSTTIFSMFYTFIDHRNDATKCSKLCSETNRQRLVVPLEFWTFYVVISMVHKSVDHRKLRSTC